MTSTPELACARCRERKIRCGREKEQCSNCRRDGAECEYSAPGKRVNHVKLLCGSVEALQDQLRRIEDVLATLVLTGGVQAGCKSSAVAGNDTARDSSDAQPDEEDESDQSTRQQQPDRHIFRDHLSRTDRYHGPDTLLTLCHEFQGAVVARIPEIGGANEHGITSPASSPMSDAIEHHLNQLSWETGHDTAGLLYGDCGSFDNPTKIPIRLPPRQLLLVAQSQFFQHCPWASEIFVPARFREQVERLYSHPLTLDDEPWALCMHIITLLVLGPEILMPDHNHNPSSGSYVSALLGWQAAFSSRSVLIAPQLINVQTLALLSRFAQQYYPLHFAESIRAQACVLAKAMGLHQLGRRRLSDFSEAEVRERLRLFQFLYIQEMGYAMTRGSTCWLLSLDCDTSRGPLSPLTSEDPSQTARLQLAEIQEEIYRLIHTETTQRKEQSLLRQLMDRLDKWANAQNIYAPRPRRGLTSIAQLRQGYHAARLVIISRMNSNNPSGADPSDALFEARINCALLLVACCACDPFTAEQLAPTRLPHAPLSHPLAQLELSPDTCLYSDLIDAEPHDLTPLPKQNALERFPIRAFFTIATDLAISKSLPAQNDFELLHRVRALHSDLVCRLPAHNNVQKTARVIQMALDTIQTVHGPNLHSPDIPVMSNKGTTADKHAMAAASGNINLGPLPTPEESVSPAQNSTAGMAQTSFFEGAQPLRSMWGHTEFRQYGNKRRYMSDDDTNSDDHSVPDFGGSISSGDTFPLDLLASTSYGTYY